jgi:pilus assembly protein Flp/PilA
MQGRLLTIMLRVSDLLKREEGQAAVEYGVLVALIIAVCVAAIKLLGGQVNDAFNSVTSALGGA